MAAGHGEEHPPTLVGGHARGKVGGGFVVRFLLVTPLFQEQAVGHARKHPMDPDGVAVAQPGLVVAPRDVQPGVQSVLNAPVLAVAFEPAGGREFCGRQAGDQRHGFRFLAVHFAAQSRGLGGQGKAGGFGRDGGGAERAGFGAAFVAFVCCGPGSRRVQGEKSPAEEGRGVRGFPARWAGCL